jgi:hypothetical protein
MKKEYIRHPEDDVITGAVITHGDKKIEILVKSEVDACTCGCGHYEVTTDVVYTDGKSQMVIGTLDGLIYSESLLRSVILKSTIIQTQLFS